MAEIPVVVPLFASIETVNAVVSKFSLGLFLIGVKSNLSAISVSIDRQINPLPYVAIKFITSGVANSAATIKSPSFSLSASSTKMTIFPFFISFIASSMLEIGNFNPQKLNNNNYKYILN